MISRRNLLRGVLGGVAALAVAPLVRFLPSAEERLTFRIPDLRGRVWVANESETTRWYLRTQGVLAGEIRPWLPPREEGWLIADGRVLSRAKYPALFQAIGVRYGG